MISLQEVLTKTATQGKAIQEVLDRGFYHPAEASLYDGLSRADASEVREIMSSFTLAELLAKSGASTAAGLQGSNYLLAAKTYDTLVSAARTYDIAPLVSSKVVTQWEGNDLKVQVAKDNQMRVNAISSGGRMKEGGDEWVQCTATPYLWGVNVSIGNDLLEDNSFDLIQRQVERAGEMAGYKSTNMILTALSSPQDGDGTANTGAAGSNETTWQQVLDSVDANGCDEFVSNTLITTPESWSHSIHFPTGTSAGTALTVTTSLPAAGFDFKMHMLDVLLATDPIMHASTDVNGSAFTDCKSFIFDRKNALLTARKRWLQMENYADPTRDLVNCVVTFRQDVISLYKDSICILTET